jgi:hypothetical protein
MCLKKLISNNFSSFEETNKDWILKHGDVEIIKISKKAGVKTKILELIRYLNENTKNTKEEINLNNGIS